MPNTKVIGQIIKEQDIPLLIIMGEFDKIIRPSQAYRFIKKNPDMTIVGLRFFNVFGPNQSEKGFYSAVIPKWLGLLMVPLAIYCIYFFAKLMFRMGKAGNDGKPLNMFWKFWRLFKQVFFSPLFLVLL